MRTASSAPKRAGVEEGDAVIRRSGYAGSARPSSSRCCARDEAQRCRPYLLLRDPRSAAPTRRLLDRAITIWRAHSLSMRSRWWSSCARSRRVRSSLRWRRRAGPQGRGQKGLQTRSATRPGGLVVMRSTRRWVVAPAKSDDSDCRRAAALCWRASCSCRPRGSRCLQAFDHDVNLGSDDRSPGRSDEAETGLRRRGPSTSIQRPHVYPGELQRHGLPQCVAVRGARHSSIPPPISRRSRSSSPASSPTALGKTSCRSRRTPPMTAISSRPFRSARALRRGIAIGAVAEGVQIEEAASTRSAPSTTRQAIITPPVPANRSATAWSSFAGLYRCGEAR